MFDSLSKLFRERKKFDQTTQAVIESWHQTAQQIELVKQVKDSPAWQDTQKKITDELRLLISAVISEGKDYRAGRISSLIQVLSQMNTKTEEENLNNQVNDFISQLTPDA